MNQNKKLFSLGLLAFILVLATVPEATATWQTDGIPVCTESGEQGYAVICHVGNGNVVIAWEDPRTDAGDIYGQMISSTGQAQWAVNGTPICTEANKQGYPVICSDGAGGAIVAWVDSRGSDADIYVQKINATGYPQWDVNGTAICMAGDDQSEVQIVSDGEGGAIVTWQDDRAGGQIYAQRVNSTGHPNWTTDGVLICSMAGTQLFPKLCADGDGGAILTWQLVPVTGLDDVYAQKINSTGALQWDANGVTVCNETMDQWQLEICSDGAGGAIITWRDERKGTESDIYAQRINATGHPQWDANGTAICTLADDQGEPRIVSDGTGGAIITWLTIYVSYSLRVQRVSSSGTPLWSTNGIPVAPSAWGQEYPELCSDGAGGAIFAWKDFTGRVYVQRIDPTGARQAGDAGVKICSLQTAGSIKICNTSAENAVIVWVDDRNDGFQDIYAEHVFIPMSEGPNGGIPGFALLFACVGTLIIIAVYRQKLNLKK